jgi:chromosome segregation ATPase
MAELRNSIKSYKTQTTTGKKRNLHSVAKCRNFKNHVKNLQEKVAENELVETALRGQTEVLESDKKKLESVLRDEREYLEKYLQGTEKLEAAHYRVNERLQNRLQQRNRRIRELEATLHWRCAELCIVYAEARLERESANRRNKELENMVLEADCYREKVEAAPHGRIKNYIKSY